MKTATIKATIKKTKVSKTSLLLTVDDVRQIEKLAKLKLQVKAIKAELDPKIKHAVEKYGTGLLDIDDRQVQLKSQDRVTVSWASLATALLDEAIITQRKPDFSNTSTSYSAVVVD